mmetsp:Transcript_48690/g.119181  ORF Transcript_48690/g.119181 Transcript_48690/m.119181 type:complete len:86 (-) Transcript_48690:38-295(-)
MYELLTKGDNNAHHDYNRQYETGLYPPGQRWVYKRDVVGTARAYLPYIGHLTIALNEYPRAKWLLVGGLLLLVSFLSRGELLGVR